MSLFAFNNALNMHYYIPITKAKIMLKKLTKKMDKFLEVELLSQICMFFIATIHS